MAEHPRRYRIELIPAAARQLADLDQRERRRVSRRIDILAENPRPSGAKKLVGGQDLWRIRVGDYRVIYAIRDEVLLSLIVRIGHRRKIYRR